MKMRRTSEVGRVLNRKAPGESSRRFFVNTMIRMPIETQMASFFLVTRWMTNHRMTTMMTV